MLIDTQNNEVIKALVGNVEWIFSRPFYNDSLRIAFRANNKLCGLQISNRPSWTKYGHRSVEHSEHSDWRIELMERNDILGMVMFFNPALMTETEKAEWDALCAVEKRKKEAAAIKERERDLENKRRQLAELKKELGD